MIKISFSGKFQEVFSKIKENSLKERIVKQIEKIRINPECGKPMRNIRKGTRELYISPFRLSYAYLPNQGEVVLLDFYHKGKQ
jgi:mRNA-degrading endonuclease RelE of RelBE toxin-antitoxin system